MDVEELGVAATPGAEASEGEGDSDGQADSGAAASVENPMSDSATLSEDDDEGDGGEGEGDEKDGDGEEEGCSTVCAMGWLDEQKYFLAMIGLAFIVAFLGAQPSSARALHRLDLKSTYDQK